MTHYHARWVCPISSAPIRDGTVAVERGRIVYVGPRARAPSTDADVELGEVILLPGLINAHCHLELTAMRGFLDGLDFREWILRLTMARRAVLTPEMMLDAARLGVTEGLSYGITTFADTGDSGAGFDAMLEAGARGICYREVFGPDPAQAEAALAELASRVDDMSARTSGLVRVGVSPHAPYTVSDALFRATANFARERHLPMAIHIAESAMETSLVTEGTGAFAEGLRKRGIAVDIRARSPIALLAALGVLDMRPLLIHCIRVDERDIAQIAAHDCAVAHCPASNARLAHGIAPLAQLFAANVRVGLGTDSVASNDRMDMLDEARTSALFAAAREQRLDVLPASKALELATLGSARALGIDAEVGSLEMGKAADMAAFAIPDGRRPIHDPVVAAVYSIAGAQADFVMINGTERVRNGVVLGVDPHLAARVQQSADLLGAWLAQSHPSPPVAWRSLVRTAAQS